MGNGPESRLEYATHGAYVPKPERHSLLAGLSWGVLPLEVVYRVCVIVYAHHRSPTYPWERFRRNVGDPLLFIQIDQAFFGAGILLAVLALVRPNRRRALAWVALAVHLYLSLTVTGDPRRLGRY